MSKSCKYTVKSYGLANIDVSVGSLRKAIRLANKFVRCDTAIGEEVAVYSQTAEDYKRGRGTAEHWRGYLNKDGRVTRLVPGRG